MNETFRFLVSVIMPIYNTENYLDEAIDSVINQTLGFEDNIQLILVNDASSDDSELICLKYKELYPRNVVYVKNEINLGHGGARNKGIPYIEGKYVNFLDSDDKWDIDAFECAVSFLEQHYNEIDCVACRLCMFDAKSGYHPLDYKFRDNRVVNIEDDYTYIQMHAAPTFIKSKIVKSKAFPTDIKQGEDTIFINEIILECGKYGIVYDARYNYRKRQDNSSTLQTNIINKSFYNEDLRLPIERLSKYSIGIYGMIIPYIQFINLYSLKWRIVDKQAFDHLSELELEQYRSLISELLHTVDDKIILESKIGHSEHTVYTYALKYRDEFYQYVHCLRSKLYFHDLCIFSFKKRNIVKCEILDIEGKYLTLEGTMGIPFPEDMYEIYLKDNHGKKYYPQKVKAYTQQTNSLGETIFWHHGFRIKISLEKIKKIGAYISFQGQEFRIKISCGQWGKLVDEFESSYYRKDNYIITKQNNYFVVRMKASARRMEFKFHKELIQKKHIRASLLRLVILGLKKVNCKKRWMFLDKIDTAGDNAEALYDFITSSDKSISTYYVLGRKSCDYNRVKPKTNLVIYGSIKHKILYMLSDFFITASFDRNIFTPFGQWHKYLKDLYPTFIYLQHGVLEKDISNMQKKIKENFRLFITSAYAEYRSLLTGDYGYTEREVKLTGIPRHDLIIKDKFASKKKIVIAPTWRRSLNTTFDKCTGKWPYNPLFVQSEFYIFYNTLINDNRILDKLKERSEKGILRIHPSMGQQVKDFDSNEIFEIVVGGEQYTNEFSECGLLVTDYSSIAMDYAISNCAVIYTQFDKEYFYEGHTYNKGYFNYENDGFGPVYYDYKSTVDAILNIINSDYRVEDKYRQRKNDFFAFSDGKNCKRVYDEICKIK